LAQLEGLSDVGEIFIAERAGGVGDLVQVVAAVPTGPTLGAERAEQAALLVGTQHLRVDTAQL